MKIRYMILLAGLVLLVSSCDKWLNVSPKTEVKESDLFAKESGFKTALLGQYIKMSQSSLYGGNLTMGFMDVLAQYYAEQSSEKSVYTSIQKYDYKHQDVKPIVTGIWCDMYEIIANLNNIIENVDKNKALFVGNNYSIIKGEALGLRAFLHFDLLRMYAPSYAAGKDAPAIPYVNKITNVPFPQLTVSQAAQAAIKDLLAAEELLRETDPIGPAFSKYSDSGNDNAEYGADGGFLSYRRERMNYYAVIATLARVYLYAGDRENAFQYAEKAVATNRVTQEGEIFKLYTERLTAYSDRYFNSAIDADKKLVIPQERKELFYETSEYASIDIRGKSWFNYYPNSNEEFVSKYMKLPGSAPINISLIRGCEVYYIASEATDNEELAYKRLNSIRNTFGISKVYDLKPGDDLAKELYKEYRKTFVAEGQFFYYIKRKNMPQIEFSKVTDVPAVYTFPKPDNEIEFGNISDK